MCETWQLGDGRELFLARLAFPLCLFIGPLLLASLLIVLALRLATCCSLFLLSALLTLSIFGFVCARLLLAVFDGYFDHFLHNGARDVVLLGDTITLDVKQPLGHRQAGQPIHLDL